MFTFSFSDGELPSLYHGVFFTIELHSIIDPSTVFSAFDIVQLAKIYRKEHLTVVCMLEGKFVPPAYVCKMLRLCRATYIFAILKDTKSKMWPIY